ncbi:unnamed protein product [Closterium sp. Naga37s-1]|nr:unnamed protein product [Closterium sp. Naga37s-1]
MHTQELGVFDVVFDGFKELCLLPSFDAPSYPYLLIHLSSAYLPPRHVLRLLSFSAPSSSSLPLPLLLCPFLSSSVPSSPPLCLPLVLFPFLSFSAPSSPSLPLPLLICLLSFSAPSSPFLPLLLLPLLFSSVPSSPSLSLPLLRCPFLSCSSPSSSPLSPPPLLAHFSHFLSSWFLLCCLNAPIMQWCKWLNVQNVEGMSRRGKHCSVT